MIMLKTVIPKGKLVVLASYSDKQTKHKDNALGHFQKPLFSLSHITNIETNRINVLGPFSSKG